MEIKSYYSAKNHTFSKKICATGWKKKDFTMKYQNIFFLFCFIILKLYFIYTMKFSNPFVYKTWKFSTWKNQNRFFFFLHPNKMFRLKHFPFPANPFPLIIWQLGTKKKLFSENYCWTFWSLLSGSGTCCVGRECESLVLKTKRPVHQLVFIQKIFNPGVKIRSTLESAFVYWQKISL